MRIALIVVTLVIVSGAAAILAMLAYFSKMPGRSHDGLLPELTLSQITLRDSLRHYVEKIAGEIGWRSVLDSPNSLDKAAAFIAAKLESMDTRSSRSLSNLQVRRSTISKPAGAGRDARRKSSLSARTTIPLVVSRAPMTILAVWPRP
jgi:hypothetical protein